MTVLEKMKALAKIENKRMLEQYGYRGPNYGIKQEAVEGRTGRYSAKQGRPIIRSSQVIMDMTKDGKDIHEIARALNMERRSVLRTARRHGVDVIK